MASAAAIPLAAAILGHLPGNMTVVFLGMTMTEPMLVKVLSYVVFILAFLPLIFGGTIYRMIERLMTAKIVIVMGYLGILTLFSVSSLNVWEVTTGFFRFGTIPIRADSVFVGPHFSLTERDDTSDYIVKGTIEGGRPLVTEFRIIQEEETHTYGMQEDLPPEHAEIRQRLTDQVQTRVQKGRFFIEDTKDNVTIRIAGRVTPDQTWAADKVIVETAEGIQSYDGLDEIPGKPGDRARAFVEYRGVEHVGLFGYIRQHGRLPDLDWAMLAAMAAIAGAGGMSNTLLSNYARDKGWGMGKLVGAIPSAVGGQTITLSHVGKVFPLTESNMSRWRGWFRHIVRDQAFVWMLCCFVGMALPCMVSLEFIRNAPVENNRVTAMIADGVASRFPELRSLLWPLTLVISFLILAPGQIFAGESISRRWADAIWVSNPRAQRLEGNQIRYLYYGILAGYALWGLVALWSGEPLWLATIGAIFANVALGFTSFHTLYVNCTLLPKPLRPNWFMRLGLLACGVFFLTIWVVGLMYL